MTSDDSCRRVCKESETSCDIAREVIAESVSSALAVSYQRVMAARYPRQRSGHSARINCAQFSCSPCFKLKECTTT